MAGEVLNTYIVVEQGDKVLFIDKHAAHERLNFDRMKAEGYQPMVQALLEPVVFTPPPPSCSRWPRRSCPARSNIAPTGGRWPLN